MPPRTPRWSTQPFVCARCQLRALPRRRLLSTAPSAPDRTSSHTLTQPRYAHLSSRTLLRLHGPDAHKFLHDLLPAKLVPLPARPRPIYTAFMTAHGRILNDVFIYPPAAEDGPWYIEVDSASAGGLLSHLRKHKLRSKFQMEKVDAEQTGVFYRWPGDEAASIEDAQSEITTGGSDPRPGMGVRWIEDLQHPSRALTELQENASQASLKDYTVHRMLNGFAEGQSEIISTSALPQESNLDFLGGIDFHKGCYLGQELTIRTHHTGVVRKRLLPCQIYDEDSPIPREQATPIYDPSSTLTLPPSQSNISRLQTKGRSTGKWLDGVGNIGLALCRLEMMTDIQLTSERTQYDPGEDFRVQWEPDDKSLPMKQVTLRPFVPEWLRQSIDGALRVRTERGRKQKRLDEDED